MTINLDLHSIIFTFAPSGSGKSFFCKNHLIKTLNCQYPLAKVLYLSSDDIRNSILKANHHKYDGIMSTVSGETFKKILSDAAIASTYPNNFEFIIIDTTGLDINFMKSIDGIAKQNNYKTHCLAFDYAVEEYYKFNDLEYNNCKSIIDSHINKFNKYKSNIYADNVNVIKNKDFSCIDIQVNKYDEYKKCNIESFDDTLIIGDIHFCYDELKEMLSKKYSKFIFVGDLIDKGYAGKETIEFLHDKLINEPDKYKSVIGNHESYVYKRLTGEIRASAGEDINFNSIQLFQEDESLKQKFMDIVNIQLPFIKSNSVIVTHAPCENKYLGKLDNKSTKAQRNFRFARYADFNDYELWTNRLAKDFSFLVTESNNSYPLHIFGHCGVQTYLRHLNKICVDSGCVNGSQLVGISINNSNHIEFQSVLVESVKSTTNVKITQYSKGLETIFYKI